MKIAIYCVSKNGYSIALDIREKVYENSDIYISERVFKTFTDIGCRYFHFEIASLWTDDKDNKIDNKFLLKVFKFLIIFKIILTNKINNYSLL